MADNKNQHYVSRVHLKPFTRDAEGPAVNLFNLGRMRPIPDAPAKNQCSGDYFYGHDTKLVRAIQSVRGRTAVSSSISRKAVPSSPGHPIPLGEVPGRGHQDRKFGIGSDNDVLP